MSDRVFACLLSLFPQRLRREHGAEMLQLYRDRIREETGIARRVRLCFDFLVDLLIGLPQAYRNSFASGPEPAAVPNVGGVPSFSVFENEPLRGGSILAASSIGITLIAVFAFLMTHPIGYRDFTSSAGGRVSPIQSVIEKVNQPTIPDSGTSSGAEDGARSSASMAIKPVSSASADGPASTVAAAPAVGSTASDPAVLKAASASLLQGSQQPAGRVSIAPGTVPGKTMAGNVAQESTAGHGAGLIAFGVPGQTNPSSASQSSTQSRSQNLSMISMDSANLDAAERNRVIQSVASNLMAHYYDRELARVASEELLSARQHGYYNEIVNGQALASRLTFALQRTTKDRHLRVEYFSNNIPEAAPRLFATAPTSYRAAMQQENCTFEKVSGLPGNIGYIKLNSFPDPSVCAVTAHSAIEKLRGSDAIIFDLRDNTGGFPEMVAIMSAPLFDRPVRWYNPREGDGSHWLTPAGESKLAGKPVYILTSALTLSGAEQFTYDLKMLERATVVGDTTGGSAHVGVFHRIDNHFGMGIPETRIIDPYGKPDWEGTGVEPDVKVPPANALAVAEKLARERLRK